MFLEMKKVTGCLDKASQGAEGEGNERGNAVLMSQIRFYIQYKNQSLELLNALQVSLLFPRKGDSWSCVVPRQTRLFPFTEHFTFPAVYPAGNLRVIWAVRISLLGPIHSYYFFL